MSYTITINCNLGTTTSGGDAHYTVLNSSGSIVISRTNVGVVEIAPGMFSASVTLADGFQGQILWDTGASFSTVYRAVESINQPAVDAIIPTLLSRTQLLIDAALGRWQITNNQMIFYAVDNITEIARFNLLDENNMPTVDGVFDRPRV